MPDRILQEWLDGLNDDQRLLMDEHKAILEDLRKYLGRRGVKTIVEFSMSKWFIARLLLQGISQGTGFQFVIFDGTIGVNLGTLQKNQAIVTLADPKYKEKFYEFLTANKGV